MRRIVPYERAVALLKEDPRNVIRWDFDTNEPVLDLYVNCEPALDKIKISVVRVPPKEE